MSLSSLCPPVHLITHVTDKRRLTQVQLIYELFQATQEGQKTDVPTRLDVLQRYAGRILFNLDYLRRLLRKYGKTPATISVKQ